MSRKPVLEIQEFYIKHNFWVTDQFANGFESFDEVDRCNKGHSLIQLNITKTSWQEDSWKLTFLRTVSRTWIWEFKYYFTWNPPLLGPAIVTTKRSWPAAKCSMTWTRGRRKRVLRVREHVDRRQNVVRRGRWLLERLSFYVKPNISSLVLCNDETQK